MADVSLPSSTLEMVVPARDKDLGDLVVRRVLPYLKRRRVGPFVFFDHIGPTQMPVGHGMQVRPHPHIGLATMTYLFEGEIIHRDSLGYTQPIQPGAINWMTAGRGIVHSERTRPEEMEHGPRLHGIQIWLGLPTEAEEIEPSFVHHPAGDFVTQERDGVSVRVLVGSAYGATSPVHVHSPTFYVEVRLEVGKELTLPDEYEERAAYLISGAIELEGSRHLAPEMLVFRPGRSARLRATEPTHLMLLGGAPLDGERHLDWNFVSSRIERIEQAKADWRARRFPLVPGDEEEFIPLP